MLRPSWAFKSISILQPVSHYPTHFPFAYNRAFQASLLFNKYWRGRDATNIDCWVAQCMKTVYSMISFTILIQTSSL